MALFANLPRRTRLAGGIALLLLGGAFAAHAGIASVEQHADLSPPPAPPVGYEADDHFPGAALLMADAPPRPAPGGATGTAPLPALPVPERVALADMADTSVKAARPFVARGSAIDQARALQCLTTAIYYEAASEPDDGQRAVAQVVLNRVRHPAFPATVCGVVYQGSDRPVCQFSFACDGAMARAPAAFALGRARRAAARALAGDVFAPVGMATHYHTYAVTPAWNRTLVMTGVFGAHFFHRWKGWWGTPAAFRDRYAGGEPLPGPLRPPVMPVAPLLIAATLPVPLTPLPMVRPAHVDSGRPIAPVPVPTPEPAESQILDRWKDSGKPIR